MLQYIRSYLLLTVVCVLLSIVANGPCAALGLDGCCMEGNCLGVGGEGCYCDQFCHEAGDCCDDIEEIQCFDGMLTTIMSY